MAEEKNRQQTTVAKLCLICRKQYGSESSVCPEDGGRLMPIEGPPRLALAEPGAPASVVRSAGAVASISGTPSNTQQTPKTLSKGAQLALVSVLLVFSGLICFSLCWQGPNEDSGPLYKKLVWQACVFLSDRASAAGQFPISRTLLTIAEQNCQDLLDGHLRLQQTLERQSQLYASGGMFHDVEKVNTRLVAIFAERARTEADHFIAELRAISSGKAGLTPIFERVHILSRTLSAYGEYDNQEKLLTAAIEQMKKLAENDPRIAELNIDLAKCHQSRKRLREVRPLLVEAVRIRTSQEKPDAETVSALLKLAQFDRDYGKIQAAEEELAQALSTAERLPAANRAQMIECLTEYADLMRLTNRSREAAAYQLKISQLSQSNELPRPLETNRN